MSHFQVGETVKAKKTVVFMDGTKHEKGDEVVITEETLAYYNIMHRDYEKVDNDQ